MSTTNGNTNIKSPGASRSSVHMLEVDSNIFGIERLSSQSGIYPLAALEINTKREREMLIAAHESYIAQKIHEALARNVDTNTQELTRYASTAFSATVEEINAIELAGDYGKYAKMVEVFNTQNITRAGLYMLEVGLLAKEQMISDMKRSIEPLSTSAPEPPEPKPGFFKRLFGG